MHPARLERVTCGLRSPTSAFPASAYIPKEFKRDVPASALANPVGDYKERLKGKAVVAVEDGLECSVDPYKRCGLGVQVLKGIGEFEGENPLVGIVIQIEGSRLVSRYRNLEVKPKPEETEAPDEGK